MKIKAEEDARVKAEDIAKKAEEKAKKAAAALAALGPNPEPSAKDIAAKKKADEAAKKIAADAKAEKNTAAKAKKEAEAQAKKDAQTKKREDAEAKRISTLEKKRLAQIEADKADPFVEVINPDRIFEERRMNAHFKKYVLKKKSFEDYLKSFIGEINRILISLNTQPNLDVAAFKPNFGVMLHSGSILKESDGEKEFILKANKLLNMAENEVPLDEYIGQFESLYDTNVTRNEKKSTLSEYLFGLNMNKKIQGYLERCQTDKGKKAVKDGLFGQTASPDIKYKTIWTRMKKSMKEELHGALDNFKFFQDIAGKNAVLVLENFNFGLINVQGLLNMVPYYPKGDKISLQEIAEYIVSKLSPLINQPPLSSEIAGPSSVAVSTTDRVAGPSTIAVRSTKEVYIPDFLNTTVGNLKASKTVFHFKNAPNLMASHFEVSFPANFRGRLVKDLETPGKCLQSPLDTFLLT